MTVQQPHTMSQVIQRALKKTKCPRTMQCEHLAPYLFFTTYCSTLRYTGCPRYAKAMNELKLPRNWAMNKPPHPSDMGEMK